MSSRVDLSYPCPSCGTVNRRTLPLDAGASGIPCRACEAPLHFQAAGAVQPGRAVTSCAACGDDKLYIQKDFNRALGCLIVGVGAALVPWTYGLSLAACALLDLVAYRMLPMITVCYICGTRYRGLPLNPGHHPFELMSAQTWEARSLTWRRLRDRSTD